MGPLAPEGCRRLACDGALTRVLVTRHPDHQQHPSHHRHPDHHKTPTTMTAPTATATVPPATAMKPWRSGCGRRWRCCRRRLEGHRPSRWRSAGPPGSSGPPNAPPWPSATVVVCSQAVRGRWPGARPITCGTGCTAARPIWPTWRCYAGPIIERSMRAAGDCNAIPTDSSPPSHPTDPTGHSDDDIPPPPDRDVPGSHRFAASRAGGRLATTGWPLSGWRASRLRRRRTTRPGRP